MLSVISTDDLSTHLVRKIICEDSSVVNIPALGFMFFEENSTRTKESFKIAFGLLGVECINIDIESSSIAKGETMQQTIETISNYNKNIIFITRTKNILSKNILGNVANVSIINAGDACHQHPTQSLGDLLTIFQKLNRPFTESFLNGINIAIVGDIQNSRVARSNIKLLTQYGANITLVSPPYLMNRNVSEFFLSQYSCKYANSLTPEIISNSQFLMFLRAQTERYQEITYHSSSCSLSNKLLSFLPQNSFIMHPGPVNIGKEICHEAYNHENSLINLQVQNALEIRKRLISHILNNQTSL